MNGEVFNALISKIRGRSKLPQGRRIVVFVVPGRAVLAAPADDGPGNPWFSWRYVHDWDFLLPGKPFVGLQNYVDLFTPGTTTAGPFWASMRATADANRWAASSRGSTESG